MTTNTTQRTGPGAPEPSEQVGTQRKWNIYLGNECYGFVHASSAQEALDRVAAIKKPFTARLAEDQD